MRKTLYSLFVMILILTSVICDSGFAAKETRYTLTKALDRVKMQHDSGFNHPEEMTKDDKHYSWGLGSFYIEGYTEVVFENDGTPVFLKNVGDELTLGFDLRQNINSLNGEKELKISEDTNGYDTRFEVKQTNFGHGCLIVQETDYKNSTHKAVSYVDYLSAVQKGVANTKVKPFAEGDYKVALDYEIQSPGFLGSPVFNDYTITFVFKIRNSNCMVFFYGLGENQDEIGNGAVAVDGFRIDFKNSYFLNVNVTREILVDNDGTLTLDKRFSRAAKDGAEFTEEGLYTITVSNKYTKEQVTKKISVGQNKVLNVYAAHSGTIEPNEIAKQLNQGAKINNQWMLIFPEAQAENLYNSRGTDYSDFNESKVSGQQGGSTNSPTTILINVALFLVAVIVLVIVFKHIEKKKQNAMQEQARLEEAQKFLMNDTNTEESTAENEDNAE